MARPHLSSGDFFGAASRTVEAGGFRVGLWVASRPPEGVEVEMPPRPRAIVDFSIRLAATPSAATQADVQRLRDEGMQDAEILDIILSVAMFANANRLMQTLGEAVLP